ncbi:MAG: HAMP domain-containing protein [Rhodocyclaceae bacterium]|nr:HAMP domain-containing protein [Rhodocyclaceae bacterium]
MRIVIIVFAALAGIMLFLLAEASSNTTLLAGYYPLLLGINGIATAALLGLVLTQLIRLRRDFRQGVFGARLKSRLLLMMALMAVLPGVLVYAVSMQFAIKSIDSWFDVRVDTALEGGLNLAHRALDALQVDALDKARGMAGEIGDGQNISVARLGRLREQAGVHSALIISPSGRVLASSAAESENLMPDLPAPSQLRAARVERGFSTVGEVASEGQERTLVLRALVPLTGSGFALEPNILQVTQPVPTAIANSAASVESAQRDYQALQLGRSGLKQIYSLTLTLALLLALFAAIALAFFLAERLAAPLLILAEGTRAVAAGDFTPRATVAASDEMGVLTHSFNSMTQQLGEARSENERRRIEVETAQAYLESVLANLSAGVLAFDAEYRLRAANKGAITILADQLDDLLPVPLPQWTRHRDLAASITGGFSSHADEWQAQMEIAQGDARPQVLLVRGTALPKTAGGGGFVVVFDDITELIAAQRSAAWGEVARRLAHEIKNPLTPIQLCAERLQIKLSGELSGTSRDLLARATQTIVEQVAALKKMVNEFRDYARTPPPQLAAIDLAGLLRDVVVLYENAAVPVSLDGVSLAPTGDSTEHGTQLLLLPAQATTATQFPLVRADPQQLRQVLHNLFTNAQDALIGVEDARMVVSLAQDGERMRMSVSDNGHGFAPQILARAFEPYVTTKAKGTGLGLAIVKKIIDDHGGEIRLANDHGGRVSIWLPLASNAASAPVPTQNSTIELPMKETIDV